MDVTGCQFKGHQVDQVSNHNFPNHEHNGHQTQKMQNLDTWRFDGWEKLHNQTLHRKSGAKSTHIPTH